MFDIIEKLIVQGNPLGFDVLLQVIKSFVRQYAGRMQGVGACQETLRREEFCILYIVFQLFQ